MEVGEEMEGGGGRKEIRARVRREGITGRGWRTEKGERREKGRKRGN